MGVIYMDSAPYVLAFEQYEPFEPEAKYFRGVKKWANYMFDKKFPLDAIVAQVYCEGWHACREFDKHENMIMEQLDGRFPRLLSKEDYARLDEE